MGIGRINMIGLPHIPQGGALDIEAEVKCMTCGKVKWVPWGNRHAGSEKTHTDYSLVRCRDCATGKDLTYYTGHHRFKS